MRFVTFFLILFSNCGFSQARIDCYNRRLSEFIRGYPNTITVISNEPILAVTTDNGTIEKGNDDKYNVIPGSEEYTYITVKTKSKTQEFHFSTRDPASPKLAFGGQVFKETDSIIAKRFRVSYPTAIFPDFLGDIGTDITQTTIIRIHKDSNMSREVLVNDERSKLMKLAEPGDTYIFMDGKVKIRDSSFSFFIPISSIKIKD